MASDGAKIRRRRPRSSTEADPSDPLVNSDGSSSTTTPPISATVDGAERNSYFLLFLVVLICVSYFGVVELIKVRQRGLSDTDGVDDGSGVLFSSENALQHIRHMGIGSREANTPELDASLEYIRANLADLIPVAERNGLVLEVEAFTSSGSYSSSIGKGMDTVISYDNILSVVARLRPKSAAFDSNINEALLINAHVDSAADTAGVSDDLIGVGIMMEMVRAISTSESGSEADPVLRRPVVFLMNGAEEVLLAGAHGFMTTHRWAKTCAAVINIESMGAGESYLLFQLGPENNWLAHAYQRSVKLPLASSAGNDIFSRGLIPGETDYRIFKGFGVPGYDFAIITNGYVYHTGFDDLDHMSEHAVSAGGKGVFMPLTLELAGRNDAIGTHLRGKVKQAFNSTDWYLNESREFSGGSATFVDVLSVYTLTYGPETRRILNLGALVWFLFLFIRNQGAHPASTWLRLRIFVRYQISFVWALLSAWATSVIYVKLLGRPLAWFGSVYWAYLVYGVPFVWGAANALIRYFPPVLHPDVALDGMLHAVAGTHAIMLAAMHALGLASTYIPLTLILPYIIVMSGLFPRKNLTPLFAVLHAPSAILGAPNSFGTLGVFLGLLGRSGAEVPSDRTAAIFISVFFNLYFLPTFATMAAAQSKLALQRVRGVASLVILATAGVAFFMPLVYGADKSAVYGHNAPKRLIVTHFHAPQQTPSTIVGFVPLDVIPFDSESTMQALEMDSSTGTGGIKKLDGVPVFGAKELETDIAEFLRPYKRFLSRWTVFQVDEMPPLEVPHAEVIDELEVEDGKFVNVTLKVTAKNSMQISLRIPKDETIIKWSLDAPLKRGEGSWVRHIGRGKGAEQIVFSVLVRKNGEQEGENAEHGRDKVNLVVSSYRARGAGGIESKLLRRLKFKRWISSTIFFSTGSSFIL